jgi:glucokinase
MANDSLYIVADIGGTNARFSYVTSDNDRLQNIQCFPCADFPYLADAFKSYMSQATLAEVHGICLAVAGPVELDWVDLPNNHWAFSRSELERTLGIPVKIINDFTAQTLSVGALDQSELFWIGQPRPIAGQVKAVVGPGTGLGVSAMMPKGEIVPSEGGHIAFAPTDEHEVALLKTLWGRYQRVSVERLLSGMGLSNLYWANGQLQGVEKELSAPEIAAGAQAEDPLCLKAVTDFFNILGAVAGDVALTMGAAGGLYLSGGILPKIKHFLDIDSFRGRFEDKGRFREFCSSVPIALVLAEHPGLVGCVQALKINDI